MRRAPAFLTDKLCDDAAGPEPGRHYVIYWDTEVRGFGYRKTAGPARGSFVLNYRNQNGVERRLTIGTHRDPWQVKAARKRALELKTLIDQGQDPQGEKNERRSAPRMNDLIERWRAEHKVKLRPRSQQRNEYLISQWLQPEFGTRLVADIEFGDIDRLHRKIGENGTPYRANRTVALASKLFTLAIKWKIRSDNPCRGVERYPETPRERHLIADELAALSRALDEDEDRQAADIFRLLLITGARKDELCSARRGQLHLEPDAEPPRGVWTKPATNTKQKKIHRVPLSPEAVTLFAKIVERSDVALMPSAYLFPHQDGYRYDLRAPWRRICRSAGLEGLRLHDLRHSFASILAGQGLSLPIIGRLLGHSATATTARYAHLLDDPLRQAATLVGAVIASATERAKGS